MTETPQAAHRRPPVWLWVVIAVVLVLLIVLGFLLFWHPAATPVAESSRTSSPSVSATPSSTPTPTPSASTPASGGTFDSSMDDFVSAALNTQNTAVFSEGGYFTNPIHIAAAASDLSGDVTPDQAVDDMAFMFDESDTAAWDLALPASTLAAYRAGPYGSWFPVGAIVARHDDGKVFSFVGHGQTITAMYMAGSEDLLLGR